MRGVVDGRRREWRGLTAAERFWGKVAGDDAFGCWEWQGNLDSGYGQFTPRTGVNVKAHRWAYEHMVGEIPAGLHLDHLCRNRACVNPYHLEPVTCLVNVRRGEGHGSETHCRRGHEYAGENLYRNGGRRYCRACQRININAYHERQRSRAAA